MSSFLKRVSLDPASVASGSFCLCLHSPGSLVALNGSCSPCNDNFLQVSRNPSYTDDTCSTTEVVRTVGSP